MAACAAMTENAEQLAGFVSRDAITS